jgi:hypothetical protein
MMVGRPEAAGVGERPLVHQFEVECEPRGARNEGALDDGRTAADVLGQHFFIGAQVPALAAAAVDSPANSTAVDEARIGS